MVAKFLCPPDRVTGCPDTWSKIILGMSVRVFYKRVLHLNQ